MLNDALLLVPNLAREFFDPAQGYHVAGLCSELGVEPAGFARLTLRKTESVAKLFSREFVKPKQSKTKDVLRQLHQLVAVFRAMEWSPEDTRRWMHSPLPTDQGQTPLELIEQGRGQDLIDRLLALAIGNVGG